MMDRLRSKGLDDERLTLFPNWVELPNAAMTPDAGQPSYRQQLGLGASDKLILYAGNMGAKQGLEVVIEAAQRLQTHAHVHFLLVGEGPAQAGLKAMAEGLQRVHFLSLQPAERLHELLGSPDVHLLPQRAAAADLVMPSKLAGIMASGRPVVACTRADTEIASVVHDRGMVVPPEDAEALVDGIVRLLENPEQAAQWGAAARDYVEEHLNRDAVLKRFERTLFEALDSD
jgi:colanic acid biosynthesis glycosyl transferase WcaI